LSAVSEIAAASLRRLTALGAVSADLSLRTNIVYIGGNPAFELPREEQAWSWRTTRNRSLLPASVSAESRRHLLYAVLQDLVRGDLLLHEDTRSARPLAQMDPELQPFDTVFAVPPEGTSERPILFPIHIAVPTVFDTYERRVAEKAQTDKGFRGKFLEFFCSDESGYFDDHLIRVLRNLFAFTEGLTPLDRALVRALGRRLLRARESRLRQQWGDARFQRAWDGDTVWWTDIYPPDPKRSDEFYPLGEFALQGVRLHQDIDAIAHTHGPSRIERVALVERLLAYHFALYMVRLARVLPRELHWAYAELWPERDTNPWPETDLAVRFHGRRARVSAKQHAEYERLMSRLKEPYLLLPVLNNFELAIRGVFVATHRLDTPAHIRDGRWAEAKKLFHEFGHDERRQVREVLTLLADVASRHVGLADEDLPRERLLHEPVELLSDAVLTFYSAPEQRRYPKDHHQAVFEAVAGGGPQSFVQRLPSRHVVLGDELIYLLVLAMFEQRDKHQRDDSTYAPPRQPMALRRRRLPLTDFEKRLECDLLVPADDAARDDLRASLARLGLVDRRSDVGDGNFLRHPTGI
jgi:hypothetical protein